MNLTLYHSAKTLILWRGGLLATDRSTTLPGLRGFGRLREINNDKAPIVAIFRRTPGHMNVSKPYQNPISNNDWSC